MKEIATRMFATILTAVMLVGMMALFAYPVSASAPVSAEQESRATIPSIEEQIRAFAISINQSNADDTAAKALAKHGLSGGGKKLSVGKTHALTATLMNSEMVQQTLIAACMRSSKYMQTTGGRTLYLELTSSWGSWGYAYICYPNANYHADEVMFKSNWVKGASNVNAYDKSLEWMAGSIGADMVINLSAATVEQITYDVKIRFWDRFDFSSDNGDGFKDLISGFGALLFREFDWESTVSFSLTVPNECKHSYMTKTIAPTCTASGYTTYTCSQCGYSYKDTYTAKIDHKFSAWKQTTAPTCTVSGEETRVCSVCDAAEIRMLAAIAHIYQNGICAACSANDPTYIVYGDLDGNGLINTTDVVLLRRYIAGGYGVEISEKAADLNSDGTLNTTDIVLLRRYIAGGYDIVLPNTAT